MSVGNATQAVDFDRNDLTLVLGENLDSGGNGARNGTGKAQPLYSKIKTPRGWTTMGEIAVGDVIITPSGTKSTVTGIFPQGKKETYRISFSDGRYTDACKDHLWKVFSQSFSSKKENKWKTLTTAELINHTANHKGHKNKSTYYKYVPLIQPEEIDDISLPLEPYFLGAMLGDGGMTVHVHGIGFTTADVELFENMKQVLPENYQMTKNHYDDYGYSFTYKKREKYSKLRLALSDLNLYGAKSVSKFIPDIYKNASTNQKIALIQGLVDTDGHVEKKSGSLSITTVSKQMAIDIQEIIQSIGGIAKIRTKTNCGYNKDGVFIPCKDAHTIAITYHTPKTLARLSRKKDLLLGVDYQYKNRKLRIDKIEPIGNIESQCIMIDHPDHLYITDNYIVTHNTTLINALSYGLYGSAISEIKVNNLVNKTNGKNMLVSVAFDVSGTEYKIERGRSPSILRFYKDNIEQKDDAARGEQRDTQKEIVELLHLSHAMFKHAVALNTYSLPFLSMRAADQKNIIEELLGITVLTEKAEALKKVIKTTKDSIKEEEIHLDAVIKANMHIEEQIDGLKRRQRMWKMSHDETINNYAGEIEGLMQVDIDAEIQKHKDNANAKEAAKAEWYKLTKEMQDGYDSEMSVFIVEKEKVTHHNAGIAKHNAVIVDCNKWIQTIETDAVNVNRRIQSLKADIKLIDEHKCHACGQDLHDDRQEQNKSEKEKLLTECIEESVGNELRKEEYKLKLADLGMPLEKMEVPTQPVCDLVPRIEPVVIATFYDSFDKAHGHKRSLETLSKQLETAMNDSDPYDEQIDEMTKTGIVEISYDEMNRLVELQEHQAFLLKLLTSKDSFIRKKIIKQNLAYLNDRLTLYLIEIGLPHRVRFMSDLSVEITDMGRDLDFDNLSRGERTRLILSLSLAFRDVFESLYSQINLLFVDELIDNGLDTNGVEASVKLFKSMARERGKSVWLVSHRDELTSRVSNIITVTKENGFTTYDLFNEI